MIEVPGYGSRPCRYMLIGEAPGCVHGDTLIEIAYRDKVKYPNGIPIKDLVGSSNLHVYSYDLETKSLAVGEVKRVWKTGRKKVFKVTYEWWSHAGQGKRILRDSICVTEDHKFLLRKSLKKYDPFGSKILVPDGIDYLSIAEGLSVGHSIQPFLRLNYKYGFVGSSWQDRRKESRFLLAHKLGRPLEDKEQCHHLNENKLDDTWDNLANLSLEDHARHHANTNNPMDSLEARNKHKARMQSEVYRKTQSKIMFKILQDPDNYAKRVEQIQRQRGQTSNTVAKLHNTEEYYWNYLQGRLKVWPHLGTSWAVRKFKDKFPDSSCPLDNHRIVSIEEMDTEDVYDIEVPEYHNFAAQGIFVHNSTEAEKGRPFVGASGDKQASLLRHYGVSVSRFYQTNVVKLYQPGNPDPTPELIQHYTGLLLDEIREVNPDLIVCVGRFSMRWFLGEEADLDICRGMPFKQSTCTSYPNNYLSRARGAIVVPIHHVASGFHNIENLKFVVDGYRRVAEYVKLINNGRESEIYFPSDTIGNNVDYREVTGEELDFSLRSGLMNNNLYPDTNVPIYLGLDTEGTPDDPISIQISPRPGVAYFLDTQTPDFNIGIQALQYCADNGTLFATHQASTPSHGCMYETTMCRAMGLELRDAKIFDTMYWLYLQRLESMGLKRATLRWLGGRMTEYETLIEEIKYRRQVDYLRNAYQSIPPEKVKLAALFACTKFNDAQLLSTILPCRYWPVKMQSELSKENDGTYSLTTPEPIPTSLKRILTDIDSGKVNQDGDETDPEKRWIKLSQQSRTLIESLCGKLPTATLRDVVPRKMAVDYACADADFTLRLMLLFQQLTDKDDYLPGLVSNGNLILPVFHDIQSSGMPCSRSKLVELQDYLESRMDGFQSELITKYNEGNPLNPNSLIDMENLLAKRGLKSEKITKKTKKISTSKKSIEHLRHEDPAIALAIDWREHAKIRSTYCDPLIAIADRDYPGQDQFIVHTDLHPSTGTSRRLISKRPNLLNVPTRSEIGRRVRACYITPPGFVFGSWDFSGQELRVAAHVSKDKELCYQFCHCRYCGCDLPNKSICLKHPKGPYPHKSDPHAETAYRIFGLRDHEQDPFKHRIPTKTATFGGLNDLSPAGLLDQFRMNIPAPCTLCNGPASNDRSCIDSQTRHKPGPHPWTLERCEDLKHSIFRDVYAGLGRSSDDIVRATRLQPDGLVRDLTGMPRYLPAIHSRDRGEREAAGRQAYNHVIQGTAQSMTQASQIYLHYDIIRPMQRAGIEISECLQVHDELINMFEPDLWPTINPLMLDGLENHHGIKLCVPVEGEGHMSSSWSQLK